MDNGGFSLVQFQVALATNVQISIGRIQTHTHTLPLSLSFHFVHDVNHSLEVKHLIEYLHFFVVWHSQLIEAGEVYDPRYVIDEKGKAHFIFKQQNTSKFLSFKLKQEKIDEEE